MDKQGKSEIYLCTKEISGRGTLCKWTAWLALLYSSRAKVQQLCLPLSTAKLSPGAEPAMKHLQFLLWMLQFSHAGRKPCLKETFPKLPRQRGYQCRNVQKIKGLDSNLSWNLINISQTICFFIWVKRGSIFKINKRIEKNKFQD